MDLISFFPRSFFWEGIFIDFLHTPVSIDWKRIIVCRGILYFSLPRCFYYYAIHAFFFLSFFLPYSNLSLSRIERVFGSWSSGRRKRRLGWKKWNRTELIEVKHGLMAFFGKVGSSTHGETTFKYLTFGVVGVDWISLGSRIRGENSASALRMRFSNTRGPRSFSSAFPITVAKAFNGTFIRRSVAKIFVKRKEEAFGRGEGRVWPSALGCSIVRLPTHPSIHQPVRPSPVGKPICRFSNARKRATNARSLFAEIFGSKIDSLARRIASCGSVADGEEMSATRILYKRKKRNNRRGFHPLAYPRRAHARAKVVGKGGAHGYVHVCRINIYYVSRVRYLNTWGKSDSESRSYSRDFIFRMHSSLQISTTRKPVSLGAREICWKIVASGRGDVARARNNLVTCPEHDNFFSFNPRIGRRCVARISTDEINRADTRGRSRGKLLFLLDFRTWKSV